MSGEDQAAVLVTRLHETWSPLEEDLRNSVLKTVSLLGKLSDELTPGASVSLQEWVEHRMPGEVRFKKNARGSVVLEQIETSSAASGPTAAPDEPGLGQEQDTNNGQGVPQNEWSQMVAPCQYWGEQRTYEKDASEMPMHGWWPHSATYVDPAWDHVDPAWTCYEIAEVLNNWLSQNTSLEQIPDTRPDRQSKLQQCWKKMANAPADIELPPQLFAMVLPNATTLASDEPQGIWDKAQRPGSRAMQKVLASTTPWQKQQIILELAKSARMLLYHDSGCFVVSQLLEEGRCF